MGQKVLEKLTAVIINSMLLIMNKIFQIFFRLYHHDDKQLPIFAKLPALYDISKNDKDKSLTETFQLLTEAPPHPSRVCGKPPRYVKNNYAFVVDTSKLDHVRDILADDSGKWVNNGQHKFPKTVRGDSFIDEDVGDEFYTLHRHYYYNKDSRDFHRTITFVTGAYAMTFIQY